MRADPLRYLIHLVAVETGQTVRSVKRMSRRELLEWDAFFAVRSDLEKEAYENARKNPGR
jgi:hypothetical protein